MSLPPCPKCQKTKGAVIIDAQRQIYTAWCPDCKFEIKGPPIPIPMGVDSFVRVSNEISKDLEERWFHLTRSW